MTSPWETLGIPPTGDVRTVRKAYARLLKTMDPDSDPEGFNALRQAHDRAMQLAELHAAAPDEASSAGMFGADEDAQAPAAAASGAQAEAAPAPIVPEPPRAPLEPSEAAVRAARNDAAAPVTVPLPSPPVMTPSEDAIRAAMDDAVDHPAPAGASLDRRPGAASDAMRALRALVFDRAPLFSHVKMMALVEQILGDPAMQNLEHAEQVERFFADIIVNGVPRSDPMLDRVIGYFHWDAPALELRRPDAVRWILQRAQDRYFEVEQRVQDSRIHRCLRRLREPPLKGLSGRIESWFAAPHVERTILQLQVYHPTALHSLNQESYAWWMRRIQQQHDAGFPFGVLYRTRSDEIRSKRIYRAAMKSLSLLVVPLLVGGVYLYALFHPLRSASLTGEQPTVLRPVAATPVPPFEDVDHDLDMVLYQYSGGDLTAAEVRNVNPALYARLTREWTAAKGQQQAGPAVAFQVLMTATGGVLRDLLGRAVTRDDALLLDYAGHYESRLRWAERASPEECVAVLSGQTVGTTPTQLLVAWSRLLTRAVRTGTPPAEGTWKAGTFTAPPDIIEDAMQRAHLDRAGFARAMQRKGPAMGVCNARIGLIDAALVRRDKAGLTLLRALLGS
ncbi:hypothetical protein CA234_14775 [Sphingomonas sp. ABOLE]|uniref:J domain-containing protein n=1 Tax=Sphingomonas sp. ABOLE TaxID=1985878 RepID=UPI000F7E8297|nr:J domain-containing protein [Sphingomonas sp. ABOLE]RSV39513.1 hypothetical protein CA234_14775 [Sphingomonas sp. ABOLE]